MIERLIHDLLKEIGEDPTREGLEKTPARVAKAWEYLTSGYKQDVHAVLNEALFTEEYDEMVVVKDIDFYSLCVPSKQIVNAVGGAKPARQVAVGDRLWTLDRGHLRETNVVAISSRAFFRLAAAKTTMSFCAWAMPGRNDKASARPSQRLFNIPASVSGSRYSRLYITARPELVCREGEPAKRHQQQHQQRGDQHLVGRPERQVEADVEIGHQDADGIDAVHQAVPGGFEQDGGQGGGHGQQGQARKARAQFCGQHAPQHQPGEQAGGEGGLADPDLGLDEEVDDGDEGGRALRHRPALRR